MDLKTYMEQHPMTEDEAEELRQQQRQQSYLIREHDRKVEDRRSAMQMKAACMDSLKQGAPPEFILLQAMQCIGSLTDDPEYGAEAADLLRKTYVNIEQESLLTIGVQETAENLETLLNGYIRGQKSKIDAVIHQLGITTAAAMKCRQALDALDEARNQ